MGSHKHRTTKSAKTLERLRLQKVSNYRSMQEYNAKMEHNLELSRKRARQDVIESYFGPWDAIPEALKMAISMMSIGDIRVYGDTFVKSLDLKTTPEPLDVILKSADRGDANG